jgi:hypothetical protein
MLAHASTLALTSEFNFTLPGGRPEFCEGVVRCVCVQVRVETYSYGVHTEEGHEWPRKALPSLSWKES